MDLEGPVHRLALRWLGKFAALLNMTCGSRAHGRLGILIYHRLSPRISGLPEPDHNVTPGRFRQQISGLLQQGFSILPLREVLDRMRQGRTIPPRSLVLTFDDGYESVYHGAWPILRELSVPATIFVATSFLDSESPFPYDGWGKLHQYRAPPESYRLLTSAQCQEMLDSGEVDLGAHSHTHADFRKQPGLFQEDVLRSVRLLRRRFGLRDVPFAFPFGCPARGFADEVLVQAAKRSDVICGLTTQSVLVDPRLDPFHWGRFNVFGWDTARTLAGKLAGWYSWAPPLRRFFHRYLPHRTAQRPPDPGAIASVAEEGRAG